MSKTPASETRKTREFRHPPCDILNRVLLEVQKRSTLQWMVTETVLSYDLYVRATVLDQWSRVNFYRGRPEVVDNFHDVVIAYLYGVLAGIKGEYSL